MGESYYEVLEVDPDASRDEIESAYRDRVLETHPDHSDDPDAAERFQRVTTARSVLTDGAERARYDRLGHDAYVGLARGPAGDGSSGGDDTTERSSATARESSARASAAGRETAGGATESGATAGRNGTTGRRTGAGHSDGARTSGRTRSETGTDRDGRTGSHHARQRARRQRRRKQRRAAGGWPFDGDRSAGSGRSDSRSTATAGAATDADTGDESGFRYAVHDWDGEVDLEWEGPPIDQRTAVSAGSIALLYPLFVAASLTPLFSLPVNAVVAACTLALVGYLLTMPRLATVAFGVWSVLFPVGMIGSRLVDPLSVFGVLTLGFAWVPFGYAVALWWALRP